MITQAYRLTDSQPHALPSSLYNLKVDFRYTKLMKNKISIDRLTFGQISSKKHLEDLLKQRTNFQKTSGKSTKTTNKL